MEYKDIRIKSDENLESQVQTLKEYYWVKSKSGAIKKAIHDCSTVAEHKNIIYWVDEVLEKCNKKETSEKMLMTQEEINLIDTYIVPCLSKDIEIKVRSDNRNTILNRIKYKLISEYNILYSDYKDYDRIQDNNS